MPVLGKVFGAYNAKDVSDANSYDTGRETLVQQHFADEVDINTIVRRFGITAGMPFGRDAGMYGDFTGITDFESAVALVDDAEQRFMRLPADLRERFNNNPGELVAFAQRSTQEEFDAAFAPVPVAPAVVPPVVR